MVTTEILVQLENVFQKELQAIDTTSPCQHNKDSIVVCQKFLNQLEEIENKIPKLDLETEILWLRKIKPTILGSYYFFQKVAEFKLKMPIGSPEAYHTHLKNEQNKVLEFVSQNQDFVYYLRSGETNRDSFYFTRSYSTIFQQKHNIKYRHIKDSACMSEMVAEYLCEERFHVFLMQKQLELDQNGTFQFGQIENFYPTSHKIESPFKWTSTKADLVELINALVARGAINHGKIEITKITQTFAQLFNIKIADPHKTFSEIEERKKSQSKFLDELTESLCMRIANSDSFH